MKRVLLAALAVVFFSMVGLLAARWPGGSLYLVPLGPLPPTMLDVLAAHVQTKFGLYVRACFKQADLHSLRPDQSPLR